MGLDVLAELTVDQLADLYIECMKAASSEAFAYVDNCIRTRVAWSADTLMSKLKACTRSDGSHGLYHIMLQRTHKHLYVGSGTGAPGKHGPGGVASRFPDHFNPLHRETHKSKYLYRLWDQVGHSVTATHKVALRISPKLTAQHTRYLVLLFEQINIELFAGFHNYVPSDYPAVLPSSLLQAFASHIPGAASMSLRNLRETLFGCRPTNASLPLTEEVIINALDRMIATRGRTFVRPYYGTTNGAYKIGLSKNAFSISCTALLNRLIDLGYSREDQEGQGDVLIQVTRQPAFTPDNYAMVDSNFAHDQLPDIGRITVTITWKHTDDSVHSFYLTGAHKTQSEERLRIAIQAQTLWELVQGILPPISSDYGLWREDLRQSTLSQKSARAYGDETLTESVFPQADEYARNVEVHCKCCDMGPYITSALFKHLGMDVGWHEGKNPRGAPIGQATIKRIKQCRASYGSESLTRVKLLKMLKEEGHTITKRSLTIAQARFEKDGI
ncbi:hypothetical protein LTR85_007330 [Meristemomyces frigidus]|nr:hypothetical protein LTR85_007330 [Meristemomyces frigidus]